MKHYDYVEWVLYKKNLLDEKIHDEMEDHLYLCDKCMNIFLSLIDEREIEEAGRVISEDFIPNMMANIKGIKPIKKVVKKKKRNKSSNDLLLYYAAVASVAIIFTATGMFGRIVDIVPEISFSISLEESKFQTNRIYNLSETITNKTSKFINNFQFQSRIKED